MGAVSREGRDDQARHDARDNARDADQAMERYEAGHRRGSPVLSALGFSRMELFAEAGEADQGEAGGVEEKKREDAEFAVTGVDDECGDAVDGGGDFQDGDQAGGGLVGFRDLGTAFRGADKSAFDAEYGFQDGAGV